MRFFQIVKNITKFQYHEISINSCKHCKKYVHAKSTGFKLQIWQKNYIYDVVFYIYDVLM
jgi:hypothetical protein